MQPAWCRPFRASDSGSERAAQRGGKGARSDSTATIDRRGDVDPAGPAARPKGRSANACAQLWALEWVRGRTAAPGAQWVCTARAHGATPRRKAAAALGRGRYAAATRWLRRCVARSLRGGCPGCLREGIQRALTGRFGLGAPPAVGALPFLSRRCLALAHGVRAWHAASCVHGARSMLPRCMLPAVHRRGKGYSATQRRSADEPLRVAL